MFLFDKLISLTVVYIRPFIKWFLHTFTRLCELQRICYGAHAGACRTRKVEQSLELSQNIEIKELIREFNEVVERCTEEDLFLLPNQALAIVQRVKHIKYRCHPDFGILFGGCVLQIWSYRHLEHSVERLRAEQYDSGNSEHERKLCCLWNTLMPNTPLKSRISKQWQYIGFQGDDPKTDFRGMGLLGLENLLYFVQEYTDTAHHIFLHSVHPIYGYTFAIVGINLTAMAYRLLKLGYAKTHFFNLSQASKKPCSLENFHQFYSYLFFEFDRFWVDSEPRSIMDFREIYQNFEISIVEALENDETLFRINLLVENI